MPRNYRITISDTGAPPPPPQISTSIVLSVSPGGPSVHGTTESMTATVTPASGGSPTGLVQFIDGGVVISTQALVAGAAAYSVILSDGSHQVQAVYLPDSAWIGSSSAVLAYTVNAQTATTTTLVITSITPASPATPNSTETYTATVSPSNAPGTVQFFDGSTKIGPAIAVGTGGTAITSSQLSNGATHTINATFTPTNSALFTSSTAPSKSYTVKAVPATGKVVFAATNGASWSVTHSVLKPIMVRTYPGQLNNWLTDPTVTVVHSENPTTDFADPTRSSAAYITQRDLVRGVFHSIPDSAPNGNNHRGSIWHEPEHKAWSNPATWQQGLINLWIDVLAYYNTSRTYPFIMYGSLMGSSIKGSPPLAASYYAGNLLNYIQEIGIDCYALTELTLTSNFAGNLGLPWCAPEYGSDPNAGSPDPDSTIVARMVSDQNTLNGMTAAQLPNWILWFNNATTEITSGTTPHAQADWIAIENGQPLPWLS